MKTALLWFPALLLFNPHGALAAASAISVLTGHDPGDALFNLPPVPPPALNDAATGAVFQLLDGQADPNSGGLAVLQDGRVPASSDSPRENFFFARGSTSPALLMDLGQGIEVKSIATYSWHQGGRAGQRYALYAASGGETGFQPAPAAALDPTGIGWTLLATVDTSAKGPGQHGAEISGGPGATLGKYRYLLFRAQANPDPSGFGQTFFSEIDVTDAKAPPVQRLPTELLLDTYQTDDGKYNFTVDSTRSPDLREWFGNKAMPAVKEWYPKITALISVPGFPPPDKMTLRLQEGEIVPGNRGIPAFAAGGNIVVSSDFLRSEAGGEAIGCVIHEIVHVAQTSHWGPQNHGRVPTWVVEGVADYVRWFLFEPESRGAVIQRPEDARYDASYRTTANFFDWVIRNHIKDLPRKLNATFSTGYEASLWREWSGKPVQELAAAWKKSLFP
jgi:hypothetical protein